MNKFGEYLKEKRMEKGLSTRNMANELQVSVSYISELESGKKMPPNSKEEKYNNLIEKIGECLSLTKEESEKLRNLADSDLGAKGYLSNDMTDYIENVPLAMAALRKAKDAHLTESEWNEIIKKIDNK